MSRLSEIAFSEVSQKEFDIRGKKVLLKTLKTKDNITMTTDIDEDTKRPELLAYSVDMLSKAIVSVDGVIPDSQEETKEFLLNQEAVVIFEILSKYQELNKVTAEDVKNLEGTSN